MIARGSGSAWRSAASNKRINDQWRVCFVWDDGDACDVEITDYH